MKAILLISLFNLIFSSCSKKSCNRGHLDASAQCDRSDSLLSPLGMGWSYNFAQGPVVPNYCKEIRESTDKGWTQGFGEAMGVYELVTCQEFLKDFVGYCAHLKDGNKVGLLAVDENCQEGVFFSGFKKTLSHGKILSF